jgi:hypothetical protein
VDRKHLLPVDVRMLGVRRPVAEAAFDGTGCRHLDRPVTDATLNAIRISLAANQMPC